MASPLRFDGRVVLITGAGGGEPAKAGGRAPASLRAASPLFRAGDTRAVAAAVPASGLREAGEGAIEATWEASTRPGGATWEDVGQPFSEHEVCRGGRGGAGQPGAGSWEHRGSPSGVQPARPPLPGGASRGPRPCVGRAAGRRSGLQGWVTLVWTCVSAGTLPTYRLSKASLKSSRLW